MLIDSFDIDKMEMVAPLVAEFRVALMGYKGIRTAPDIESAEEELLDYLNKAFPVFIAMEGENCVGYVVCRVEEPCVWVESLFVREEYRRRHIASALFARAEEIAKGYGEETVYNYVHPNNDGIIAFLKSRGYNVLNLIEVRKPYAGEKPAAKIRVGDHDFDY